MKTLLFLQLLFVSSFTLGQELDSTGSTSSSNRFSFGVNVCTDYCFRDLKNNNGSSTSDTIIAFMNDLETFKIGYTAGLNVCFKVTNKFSVEAGLQYSNKGYSFKMQELVYGDMIDPRYGFIYPTNGPTGPTKLKFVYNYHYFDIPIRAILCFGNKKLKLITSAGITTNLLVNATTTSISTYEDGNIVRKTSDQAYNYKTLNLSPSISAGFIYSINDKIHLQAEPTLRYGILKIIDSPVTAYLWNSGLNISIYYAVK